MIYATYIAAKVVADVLNSQRGYAPAYVYREFGVYTVIRTYDQHCGGRTPVREV
jgi:hypothetical protein